MRPTPDRDEAQRDLLRLSIRSMGVATAKDLRDYFRLPAAECKQRIVELIEAGDLAAGQGRRVASASVPRPPMSTSSAVGQGSGTAVPVRSVGLGAQSY